MMAYGSNDIPAGTDRSSSSPVRRRRRTRCSQGACDEERRRTDHGRSSYERNATRTCAWRRIRQRSRSSRRRLHAHMTGSARAAVVELDEEVAVSQNLIRHRSRGRRPSGRSSSSRDRCRRRRHCPRRRPTPDSGDDIEISPTVTAPPVTSPESRPTPTTVRRRRTHQRSRSTAAPGVRLSTPRSPRPRSCTRASHARGTTRVPVTSTARRRSILEVASGIESCSPYLDTIAAARVAAPSSIACSVSGPTSQGQYTVVFPDEQVAKHGSMWSPTDTFLDTCAVELFDAAYSQSGNGFLSGRSIATCLPRPRRRRRVGRDTRRYDFTTV